MIKENRWVWFVVVVLGFIACLIASGCGYCNKSFCWSSKECIKELNNKIANQNATIIEQKDKLDKCEWGMKKLEFNKNKKIERLEKELKACEERIGELIKRLNNKIQKARIETSSIISVTAVAAGDWLSSLAEDFFGDYRLWPLIYWENQDQIKNPDLIYPEQMLTLNNEYNIRDKDRALKMHEERYLCK